MIPTESLIILVEFINFLLNVLTITLLFKKFISDSNSQQHTTASLPVIARSTSSLTASEIVYEKPKK